MRPGTTPSALLCGLAAILFGLAALPGQAHAEDPTIATVTVAGRKEPVAKKLDKTVHDVSTMARAANGTAQDVLQSTPGISVTADGHVAVKGNDQVTVLVDGKSTAMMSGDERAVALQTMSGADIASVEVITNPSAAYQANGGAIVNIVLKRNRKRGARAQVRGSAADHGLWNAGLSGDATGKDASVHGSVAYRRDGTQKWRHSAVDWRDPSGDRGGYSVQGSGVFVRRIVRSAALGFDYTLSDSDNVRDSVSLSLGHNERRSRPLLDTLNARGDDAGEAVYHRISEGPNEQSDDNASLAYTRRGGGMALKAGVQRSRTVGLVDKSYRDVFVEPARVPAYSHGATRSARRLDQATLDWSRASGNGQWGMGLDFQDEVNDLRNYQASIDAATGAETPDPDTTNGYLVKTTLAAAYLTDRIRYKRWEVLLGGRFERMALQVDAARAIAPARDSQAFNPSLHVEYAVTEKAAVTLSYRRSLQRPDPRDLNPFATYVDAQNLGRGNPGLTPQRLASWEAGATATGARLGGSLGAFDRTSRDTVVDARTVTGNVLVTSKQNGGIARSTGVTAAADWTPDAKLRLDIDGSVYRILLSTPDASALVRQHGTSGTLNFKAAFDAGQDQLSLDAHVQASAITPLGRRGSTSNVNVTWKRALTGSLDLTVNASDLFDGSKRTYRTSTGTFRQAGYDHFVARRLYVGFVRKIG